MSYTADVREFMEKFGQRIPETVQTPPPDIDELRMKLVREEFEELERDWQGDDHVQIADSIGDLIYVLCGMALAYGIDLDRVWDEIHRANMRKVGGATRADGKILKPEGWVPPDISGVLYGRGAGMLSSDEGRDVREGDE